MTKKEIATLIDWLKAQGIDDAKIVECILTISGTKKNEKEKAE